MRLRETHPRLSDICRTVERMTSNTEDIANLDIEVELLDSFDKEISAQPGTNIQNNPAAYSQRRGRIVVNDALFFDLPKSTQEIVLIHEAAHAYLHLLNSALLNERRFDDLAEDYVVDLLLCRWGFDKQLIDERSKSYGNEYCNALRLWRHEANYIEAMRQHRMLVLAGVLRTGYA